MSASSTPAVPTVSVAPIKNFERKKDRTQTVINIDAADPATAYFDESDTSLNDTPTPNPSFAPRTENIQKMILTLKSFGDTTSTDKKSAQKINEIITLLRKLRDYEKPDIDAIKSRDIASKYLGRAATVSWNKTDADADTGKADLYQDTDRHAEIGCNADGKKLIENKLQKCFDLEILYLRKHSELINVFKFTLQLYNKFRKSTRLLLYLLKHLIYTESTGPADSSASPGITIDIPNPVIQNIQSLIKDQKAMTTLMGNIKGIVNNTDIKGVLDQSPDS